MADTKTEQVSLPFTCDEEVPHGALVYLGALIPGNATDYPITIFEKVHDGFSRFIPVKVTNPGKSFSSGTLFVINMETMTLDGPMSSNAVSYELVYDAGDPVIGQRCLWNIVGLVENAVVLQYRYADDKASLLFIVAKDRPPNWSIGDSIFLNRITRKIIDWKPASIG